MENKNLERLCPCGSEKHYGECCGALHNGAAAASPEALMRSRYVAVCLNNTHYLDRTTLNDSPADEDKEQKTSAEASRQSMRWMALHILDRKPPPYGDRAWVEFVVFYEMAGKIGQLHEKSWFTSANGQWLYTDGEIRPEYKWGRNDICWCGSGIKNKKCHS